MALTLPNLPYAYDALEPYIDEQTMRIHHGKHHAAYLAKFTDAVKGTAYENSTIESLLADLSALPANLRGPVQNHGGGFLNHNLFWEVMGPNAGGTPVGDLATAINSTFGSLDNFKTEFATAAAGRFGSGWAWLVVKKAGGLAVTSSANQDSPLMSGDKPVLGLDVWEHAYYLKYQNRRPEYISAFWSVVNWKAVATKFGAAK